MSFRPLVVITRIRIWLVNAPLAINLRQP